jgi:hypothetical protein
MKPKVNKDTYVEDENLKTLLYTLINSSIEDKKRRA